MKWWWVVIAVFAVPLSTPAAENIMRAVVEHDRVKGGEGNPPYPYRYRSMYLITSTEELDHVRIKIRLYIDTLRELKSLAGARCSMLMRPATLALSQIMPIHGDSSMDFWVSRLNAGANGTIMVAIEWPENPQLGSTSLEVTSDQGRQIKMWPPGPLKLPYHLFVTYRDVPLEAICQKTHMVGVEPQE